MPDSLGDRMKRQYEDRARFALPRRTYTILRADGKAFHSFTRRCEKPYDRRLVNAMDYATMKLCEEAQGVTFAYVQSDEISLLLTDFAMITTEAWFDGNVQKIVSVAAGITTAAFNYAYFGVESSQFPGVFDARVFTIPDPVEVENYFIWRQQDAVRNSIQGLAQAQFSHKELHGLNCDELQEKLFHDKGINWNDTSTEQKRGRCIVKNDEGWIVDRDIPTFTQQREYLTSRIPRVHEAGVERTAVSV